MLWITISCNWCELDVLPFLAACQLILELQLNGASFVSLTDIGGQNVLCKISVLLSWFSSALEDCVYFAAARR
jgi:hypothetical protein